MDHIELKKCLTTLRWSTLTLAEALRIDAGTVVDWYFGRAEAPPEVAAWLRILTEAVRLHPAPDLSSGSDNADDHINQFLFSSVGATAVPR
jgi:hypothetical protein